MLLLLLLGDSRTADWSGQVGQHCQPARSGVWRRWHSVLDPSRVGRSNVVPTTQRHRSRAVIVASADVSDARPSRTTTIECICIVDGLDIRDRH
jgi:hypothetical protein